ncbi:MAG: YbgC/FadM family acyl-CoA thioesterase [Chitinispirillaceae bacterium]|nr:YbgC/FadM family acyl-CoA thioesterase [Chitinispirillaceae bacterium]
MQIRVYYEDTDCGNVVYYANYLKYMERSRTEFLRDRGIDIAAYHDQGKMFAVIEAHVFYKVPAKYNDLLEVDSCIKEITATTIRFTTAIRNGTGSLLVTGDVRLACITTNGRPTRIPAEIRQSLES